jgi:hypothetical protein
MVGQYETIGGPIAWESSPDGLVITRKRGPVRLRWQEISRAGLVSFDRPEVPSDSAAQAVPGLDRVFRLNTRLAGEYRGLVMARGPSTFSAVRVPIPTGEPEAVALVEEVRRHLGDRWAGELPMARHGQALGMGNPWWYYPLLILGLAVFGLVILLAAGAFQALATGSVADVPPPAWFALLAWLVITGVILFLYRKWT